MTDTRKSVMKIKQRYASINALAKQKLLTPTNANYVNTVIVKSQLKKKGMLGVTTAKGQDLMRDLIVRLVMAQDFLNKIRIGL